MIDYVVFAMCVPVVIGAAYLYLTNIVKAIKAVKEEEYTIKTGIRIIGIFMFVVGIIMGLV